MLSQPNTTPISAIRDDTTPPGDDINWIPLEYSCLQVYQVQGLQKQAYGTKWPLDPR
jgi:hypothetical protein